MIKFSQCVCMYCLFFFVNETFILYFVKRETHEEKYSRNVNKYNVMFADK